MSTSLSPHPENSVDRTAIGTGDLVDDHLVSIVSSLPVDRDGLII